MAGAGAGPPQWRHPQAHPERAMQFTIQHAGPIPDIEAVHDALVAADPAAVLGVDRSGTRLRVSTCMHRGELLPVLRGAGLVVAADAVQAQASECCGGCGG
jgi:hypothetical protein